MDFAIEDCIHLVQPPHVLDLHNDFDFLRLEYSVEKRILRLDWRRRRGDWVRAGTPGFASIEFREVAEFRFLQRDARMPFTEDDCVSTIGYLADEPWCEGVFTSATPDPAWLLAIEFQSGAVAAVNARSAHATIQP